ncbi:phage terminase large subunit [Bradyrhizobium sp. 179]|uniref:phage terminase large subunit n=1 Tax=Bradyrhizobium sp. 179 TaxID=2782648 RepID=UPI001FFB8ED3
MSHRPHQNLKMHGKQREVFQDPHRFKCVVAGRRWGKTQMSKLSICRAMVKPRQLIWYVAPTYAMARGIMWEELKEAIPRDWVVAYNETRMTIRLRNGTRIELKGADKPDTLRGVGIHLLIIDEAQDIKPDTWYKVLRPTLASTGGQAIIIGTPKSFNWLYDVYMLGQKGDVYRDKKGRLRTNTWKSWQFPTITSPFIPKAEVEAARQDMDEKSFRQEFEASFETMSGRVYYAFDRKVHVGDYPFNPRLPIWIGQDFNIDPMSSVVMQPQPNGEVWIVDEVVLRGSNTQETADELGRRYFRWQKNITIYPDPAGAQRSTKGRGESDIDILKDAGFRWVKFKRKHPKIADRVNAVNRMWRAADGTVKMRINQTCKHTIAGFEQTIYKEGSREVDKTQGLEHPTDACGYCIDIEFPWRSKEAFGISI